MNAHDGNVSTVQGADYPAKCSRCDLFPHKWAVFPGGLCLVCREADAQHEPLPTGAVVRALWGMK